MTDCENLSNPRYAPSDRTLSHPLSDWLSVDVLPQSHSGVLERLIDRLGERRVR